jgi:hypothetical protein
MDYKPVALFGEAERGVFAKAYLFKQLPQLMEHLGHPPPDSKGLAYAIQVLMYQRTLLFFRVEEEGFSYHDYFEGLKLLEREWREMDIAAICLPGVGNTEIIEVAAPICERNHGIMITTEPDLYDYLTDAKAF